MNRGDESDCPSDQNKVNNIDNIGQCCGSLHNNNEDAHELIHVTNPLSTSYVSPAVALLHSTYQLIAQQALAIQDEWPLPGVFIRNLDPDPLHPGRYQVPRFRQDGPVGIFALFPPCDFMPLTNVTARRHKDSSKLDKNRDSPTMTTPATITTAAPAASSSTIGRSIPNPTACHVLQECWIVWRMFCDDLCSALLQAQQQYLLSEQVSQAKMNDHSRSTTELTTGHQLLSRDVMESLCFLHSKVLHMTIAIFQEHPRLLHDSETDRQRWQHVTEMHLKTLIGDLTRALGPVPSVDCTDNNERDSTNDPALPRQQQQHGQQQMAPRLMLDAIVLTPDGAMIAGFVDVSCPPTTCSTTTATNSTTPFVQLRQRCVDVAEQVFAPKGLTSRPKQLIHVTLGRVLELPNSTTIQGLDLPEWNWIPEAVASKHSPRSDKFSSLRQAWQQATLDIMRRYNHHILPAHVQRIQQQHTVSTWTLTDIALVRDQQWMLEDYQVYHQWKLGLNCLDGSDA